MDGGYKGPWPDWKGHQPELGENLKIACVTCADDRVCSSLSENMGASLEDSCNIGEGNEAGG